MKMNMLVMFLEWFKEEEREEKKNDVLQKKGKKKLGERSAGTYSLVFINSIK